MENMENDMDHDGTSAAILLIAKHLGFKIPDHLSGDGRNAVAPLSGGIHNVSPLSTGQNTPSDQLIQEDQ